MLRMADAVMHAATPAVENGPPLLAAEFLECGFAFSCAVTVGCGGFICSRWLVLFSQWYCIVGEPLPECERPRVL